MLNMEKNCNSKFGKIGVLMGGVSSERDISLKSGKAIYDALGKNGCNVMPLDLTTETKQQVKSFLKASKISIAFIALHGRFGEDGAIQEILNEMSIPYTGSGVLASRSAIDKIVSHKIFERYNVPSPRYSVISRDKSSDLNLQIKSLDSSAVVVKPASQGSSIGVTIVKSRDNLQHAVDYAFDYEDRIIIEEYIPGREMTVGIFEDKPLPIIEIIPKKSFFDFQAKYEKGMTEYTKDVNLPENVYKKVQEVALNAHLALGCKDFSRVDLMLKEDDSYVLEVNTIPGFTATSLLPKAASAVDVDFPRLCIRLLELAHGKKEE